MNKNSQERKRIAFEIAKMLRVRRNMNRMRRELLQHGSESVIRTPLGNLTRQNVLNGCEMIYAQSLIRISEARRAAFQSQSHTIA